MKRTMFIFALALVVFLGLLWVAQHRRLSKLFGENDSLRTQLEEARREAAKVVTRSADTGNGLTQAQFSELLRLRAEVTQLRELTNAIAKLREENGKLHARASVPNNTAGNTNFAAGEEVHEKDSWTFAGYDSPENTFQSVYWALSQTNRDAFLAGWDSNSDMYASFAKVKNFGDLYSKMKSFRFTGPARMFGGFALVNVSSVDDGDPDTKAGDILFKKNGDSWQIVGAPLTDERSK